MENNYFLILVISLLLLIALTIIICCIYTRKERYTVACPSSLSCVKIGSEYKCAKFSCGPGGSTCERSGSNCQQKGTNTSCSISLPTCNPGQYVDKCQCVDAIQFNKDNMKLNIIGLGVSAENPAIPNNSNPLYVYRSDSDSCKDVTMLDFAQNTNACDNFATQSLPTNTNIKIEIWAAGGDSSPEEGDNGMFKISDLTSPDFNHTNATGKYVVYLVSNNDYILNWTSGSIPSVEWHDDTDKSQRKLGKNTSEAWYINDQTESGDGGKGYESTDVSDAYVTKNTKFYLTGAYNPSAQTNSKFICSDPYTGSFDNNKWVLYNSQNTYDTGGLRPWQFHQPVLFQLDN